MANQLDKYRDQVNELNEIENLYFRKLETIYRESTDDIYDNMALIKALQRLQNLITIDSIEHLIKHNSLQTKS